MLKEDKNTVVTTMAIRETIMTYFKGSCVETVVNLSSVRLRERPTSSEFQYERRDNSVRKPRWLTLSDTILLELDLEPSKVVFYTETFNRSPQLQEVREGLLEFFNQYLPWVELGDKDGRIVY